MDKNIYIYILVMGVVSYAIRAIPLTLLKKPIKNRFVRSFLYYVPYVTLAVMTFPAIINATRSPVSGIIALVAGVVTAAVGFNLIKVALSCCAAVFITELIMQALEMM